MAKRERVEDQDGVLSRFTSEHPNPVLRAGPDGIIRYANAAGLALLDQFSCRIGGKVPGFLEPLVGEACGHGRRCDLEVEAAGRWFSFIAVPIRGADYVYFYGHDIGPLKEAERELIRVKDQAQQMALHDALTGLPNRTLLEDRLQQALARSERNQEKLAVVFLDLDNFKQINDSHGHRFGDQILVAVAEELRQALRKTDTVARWGGDEMILLLPQIHAAQEALLACRRIKNTVAERFAKDPATAPLTLSMGIAVYPDDSQSPEALLQQADLAVYAAKSRGRNEVVLFGESAELDSFREKVDLRKRLERAVSAEEIQAQYQPIVAAETSQVVGVEAVACWHEESLGWIAPRDFLPLAETLGLAGQLGSQVLKVAARRSGDWQRRGWTLSLSVNIPVRQVFQENFLKELSNLTAQTGLNPGHVILEMTESQTLLALASESKRLEELSQSGFQISLAGFGQGYSSLSSLHELPIHELKLDEDFVRHLATAKGRQLVHGIVELARGLGVETVVEGVETPDQVEILKAIGAQRLQGSWFGQPMSGPELLAWLESRPRPR